MTTVKQSVHDVQIRKEHILNRQGKDFVRYEGLLDAAHRAGLQGISTSLVSEPSTENGQTAICHAEARFPWGTFSGIGDANKGNVGPLIGAHIIRMAETRAKARALRDGLNVGMAAVEELISLPSDRDGGDDGLDDVPDETHHPAPAPAARPAAPRAVQAKVQTPAAPSSSVDDEERAKYDRLVATARRLKLDVEALPADADPVAVRTARDDLLGRVNSALQAQRAPAGNGR